MVKTLEDMLNQFAPESTSFPEGIFALEEKLR
jgi:hypothetical protein